MRNTATAWVGFVILLGILSGCATDNPEKNRLALNQGLAAFESQDYQTALTILTPLADNGDAMAQNTLGRMHMQGQGIPRDLGKALQLFRRAAKQQLPNAQNNLGVMYAGGYGVQQDFKLAVDWFEKAANQGYALAMNNLADLYESGMGVAMDPAAARMWRAKSRGPTPPSQGDAVTISLPGRDDYEKAQNLYYGGKFGEAFPLFLTAAKQGNPEAQLKLASLYEYGQGVEKSAQQAKYWREQAAALGYSDEDGRDRIYLIDSGSEEGKRIPHASALVGTLPARGCACPPGIPPDRCCGLPNHQPAPDK